MRLVLILLVLVLSGCPSTIPVESVVVVNTQGGGFGSGAAVGPGMVLTAWHVAKTAISVKLPDGTVLPVLCTVPTANTDAAIIYVDDKLPAPLDVSYVPLRAGDEIIVLGSPYSQKMAGGVFFGRVVKQKSEVIFEGERPQIFVLADLNVAPGISGSPVLWKGKIVGIVVGETFSYSVLVPSADFRELFTP